MSIQYFVNSKKGLAKNVLKFSAITNKKVKISFIATVTGDTRRIKYKAKRSLPPGCDRGIKEKADELNEKNTVGLFGFRLEQVKSIGKDKNGNEITFYSQTTDTRIKCWAYPTEHGIRVEVNWNGDSFDLILPFKSNECSNHIARGEMYPEEDYLIWQIQLKKYTTNYRNGIAMATARKLKNKLKVKKAKPVVKKLIQPDQDKS